MLIGRKRREGRGGSKTISLEERIPTFLDTGERNIDIVKKLQPFSHSIAKVVKLDFPFWQKVINGF